MILRFNTENGIVALEVIKIWYVNGTIYLVSPNCKDETVLIEKDKKIFIDFRSGDANYQEVKSVQYDVDGWENSVISMESFHIQLIKKFAGEI